MAAVAVHERLPACAAGDTVREACARLARNVGVVTGGYGISRIDVELERRLDGWEMWRVYRVRGRRPNWRREYLFSAFVRYC